MPRERYLRQRAYRERNRMNNGNNYGNSYPEYDNRRGSMDSKYRYDYEREDMDYQRPREYSNDYGYDMRDYRRDYRRDYLDYNDYRRDYADDDYDKKYHKDLKKWTEKLKKFDRFNIPKEQIISNAKQMNVEFKDYDEDEFYAIYLMHISDYPSVSNDSRMYLGMAKAWLEDKDLEIEPSEKVCKYLYEIVLADD